VHVVVAKAAEVEVGERVGRSLRREAGSGTKPDRRVRDWQRHALIVGGVYPRKEGGGHHVILGGEGPAEPLFIVHVTERGTHVCVRQRGTKRVQVVHLNR